MALFLSEQYDNFVSTESGIEIHSFAEGYSHLLAIQEEMAVFTQNALVESYVYLNENVGSQIKDIDNGKNKSFLGRVWMGLKALASKIWARIKDIGRFVYRKLSEFVARVNALFSGKDVEVDKGYYTALKEAPRILETCIRMLETKYTSVGDFGSQIGRLMGDVSTAIRAASKQEGTIKVNSKIIAFFESTINKLWKQLESAIGNVVKEVGSIESVIKKAMEEGGTPPPGLDVLQEKLKAGQQLSTVMNTVSSMVTGLKPKAEDGTSEGSASAEAKAEPENEAPSKEPYQHPRAKDTTPNAAFQFPTSKTRNGRKRV